MVTAYTLGREVCPECGQGLVTERQAAPWCEQCEWGLRTFEASRRHPEIGWRWVDRLTHRAAFRLSGRQFAALSGREVPRPERTAAGIVLVVAGAVFGAAVLAGFLGGLYLTVAYWPKPLAFLGLALALAAVVLRPRLGSLDRASHPLTRDEAPTLFRLVDQVARDLQAPSPHVLAVDGSFNASCDVVGLRRRRVLTVGLQLWGSLSPQQRVALLAHELGHLLNGDVRRGVVTGMPVTTLGTLAMLTRPPRRPEGGDLVDWFTDLVLGLLHGVLRTGWIVAMWVTMRDSQRAEYLADQHAGRVAGAAAAAGLMDSLLIGDALSTVLASAARRGGGVLEWRAAADQARNNLAGQRLLRLRQLSLRDQASLFASHPPSGLRARMIESRPGGAPTVTLTDTDSDRIDAELAPRYELLRRELVAG